MRWNGRDRADSERDIAPLVRPNDALYVDTTGKTIDEVVQLLESAGGEASMIEVVKADHVGFCFGVRRAVAKVLKEAERRQRDDLYPRPPPPQPADRRELRQKGVIPIESVFGLEEGVVAFRSHGIMKEEEEYIRSKGLSAIDTTCPFVGRVRKAALYLRKNGYKVVIVGDERHPEVKSVLSYLGNDGIVLQNLFPIPAKKIRCGEPDYVG